MKKISSLVLATFVAVCIANNIAYAETETLINRGNDIDAIRAEINYIDGLDVNNIKEFYVNNEAYFKGLESRITTYASENSLTQEQVISRILEQNNSQKTLKDTLLGSANETQAENSMSDYFNSYQYHFRSGYWTYSMEPKLSTRTLRAVCSNAWEKLKETFPKIKNNENSLSDQYWCHFEAFIESGWDIEEGCPDIGFSGVVLALCNPCQNAD